MQEFDYLLKKRSKALGLFHKVIAKLESLQQELLLLVAHSKSEIEEATKEIQDHQAKISFLNKELETTAFQKGNIEKLLQ